MQPIKVHYSEELIRKAVKAYWFRVTGWRFLVAYLLLTGSLGYLIAVDDRSWFVGVLGSGWVLGLIFSAAIYSNHYRASLKRLRQMRRPEAIFEFDEKNFRISSDIGKSELPWSTICEVWRFSDFWLIFLSRAQFMTLPLADLDNEAREYILKCAESHRIKVV